MLIHERHEAGQRIFLNDCIWIQNKEMATSGSTDGHVVGLAEPRVFLIRDQRDSGEFTSDHFDRTVSRIVVDDKDFGGQVFAGFEYTFQGLLKEIPDVVIHDDDAQINRLDLRVRRIE